MMMIPAIVCIYLSSRYDRYLLKKKKKKKERKKPLKPWYRDTHVWSSLLNKI